MEPLKITFLGTGDAIPTKKRNHPAFLVSYKNENILIDCGEGTQRQFRIAHLSPAKLTRLLITHWHGDHILGIPGLFQTLAMQNFSNVLRIYGPRKTEYFLSLLNQLLDLKIKYEINENEGKIFENEDFIIESAEMFHNAPCRAYSIIVKEKRRLNKNKLKKLKLPNSPLLKQLAEGKDIFFNNKKIKASQVSYVEKGKKITIILDTQLNDNALRLAKNSDILICESTFSKNDNALAEERAHMTSVDAATLAKKAKVKKLILTHISQRYEHSPEIILNEAKKVFKKAHLANDFDVVEI